MKVMISYFNNIRNFTPNMIPLSTAMWDPSWYRKAGLGHSYIDKRGVINGLKAKKLVYSPYAWTGLVNENEDCVSCIANEHHTQDRTNINYFCPFMRLYLEQLRKIEFRQFMNSLQEICWKWYELQPQFHNIDDIIPVLIVHEKPDRLCCERYVLKQWFKENGVELEEVAHK